MKQNKSFIIQKESIGQKYFLGNKNEKLSATSVYLAGDIAEFLQKQLDTGVSVNQVIHKLLNRYKLYLPTFLPESRAPKKILQPRTAKGIRKRFCFRPSPRDYWDLKMLALSCDVSIGCVVAVMIELEILKIWKKMIRRIRGNVAITRFLDQTIETFTLKFNPFTNTIERTYHFRKGIIELT